MAENLCQKGNPNAAAPYLMKAIEDKNNMDAFVQMAFLLPDMNDSVECLETGLNHSQ